MERFWTPKDIPPTERIIDPTKARVAVLLGGQMASAPADGFGLTAAQITAIGNLIASGLTVAQLTALATLSTTEIGYLDGVTAFADTLLDDATQGAARTTLGLGSTDTPDFNGVVFPATQVPNANVNTLDDYEEGTWTPSYVSASGSFGAITYDPDRVGYYQKIGNNVFFQGYIATDSFAVGTGSGALSIGGLPFTVPNVNRAYAACTIGYRSGFTTQGADMGLCVPGTTNIQLYFWNTTQSVSNMQASHLTTGASADANFCVFGGFYRA